MKFRLISRCFVNRIKNCRTRDSFSINGRLINSTTNNLINCFSSDSGDNEMNENFPEPALDLDYLCNKNNYDEIKHLIEMRKQIGNIDKVQKLHRLLIESGGKNISIKRELIEEALRIPNRCHPRVLELGMEPFLVRYSGSKRQFDGFKPKPFDDLMESNGFLRRNSIGAFVGQRSYYLLGDLATLEGALCRYAIGFLLKRGFQLVSVPDILSPKVIEACGMNLHGERTQLFGLNGEHYSAAYLSGTSEMALAGLHMNSVLDGTELPLKFVAASRCFRAETSRLKDERGIYRVHQFTKVEMFGLTACETGSESDDMLDTFVSIQEELFSSLGLHYQLLDMPANELGSPAYRKFDIEAWMPGRQMYGEISSASNCTNYQSRRLNICYKTKEKPIRHVHTVNGTACAIPRMLIALVETYQQKNGSVSIPSVLQPYFQNQAVLQPVSKVKLNILRKFDVSS